MVLALIQPRPRGIRYGRARRPRGRAARWCQGIIRDCIGSVAVEAAIVLPMFLLLSFSAIEFGRFWWTENSLERAAKKAARYAVVHGPKSTTPASAADIEARAEEHVETTLSSLAAGKVTATATCAPNPGFPCAPGNSVTVLIQLDDPFESILWPGIGPIDVSGTATMVVSR